MSRSLRQLLIWFGLTSAGLTGLLLLNPTHFTSVDSAYYLQSAKSLLAGRGYMVGEDGRWVWNSTFPIGYSALIALFAGLTGLPVLWASKLVNGGAIALSAALWCRRIGPERTLWLMSVWWLGSFLRILAYTWSETVFLVVLAEWVWGLDNSLKIPSRPAALRLIRLTFCLFLLRYAGGYVIGVMLFLAAALYLVPAGVQSLLRVRSQPTAARSLLVITGVGLAGIGLYSWMNNHLSGSAYGGTRLMATESGGSLMALFTRAIGNELLLIRDFRPGSLHELAWAGVLIQLVWLGLLHRNRFFRPSPTASQRPELSPPVTLMRLFVLVGGLYLPVLFGLRLVSPFSGPDARLMAPATFCFMTAGLLWAGTRPDAWQRRLRPYWVGLLICSWLQLLPQLDFNAKMARVRASISRINR